MDNKEEFPCQILINPIDRTHNQKVRWYMDEKREENFLKMLGLKATKRILEFLDENGTAQYKQLQQFVNTHTLNTRMRELLDYNLVEHHLVREDVRKEWYEPTEKGKKVLHHLREMVHLIEE
ncbi:MAG: winged helix-turn-helix transcriptional regulator [Theionarchaea archaeon]|nr:MAG: hypothetical protein AYK19_15570 [Theionarchaea archaeon DG-70-1]MBU7030564.1 winged helix-turn-helix transcriptional regulator [Theionarchaea archaeon]